MHQNLAYSKRRESEASVNQLFFQLAYLQCTHLWKRDNTTGVYFSIIALRGQIGIVSEFYRGGGGGGGGAQTSQWFWSNANNKGGGKTLSPLHKP